MRAAEARIPALVAEMALFSRRANRTASRNERESCANKGTARTKRSDFIMIFESRYSASFDKMQILGVGDTRHVFESIASWWMKGNSLWKWKSYI
jgi:hypothetical protein